LQCAQFDCPACGLHYVVVTTSGTVHCLACFGRGSTDAHYATNPDDITQD
jgi:hypothetical protein